MDTRKQVNEETMVLQKQKKAGGFSGFVDSALYTLESGFDVVAKEVAYALNIEQNNNRIHEWENQQKRDADGDYSVTGSSIAADNESTTSMLKQQNQQRQKEPNHQQQGKERGDIPSLLEGRGDDENTDTADDDTTLEGREQRQDTDGIFRPTKKVDLDPYAELVRMGSENYRLASRSSSSHVSTSNVSLRITEIEENIRARSLLLDTLKADLDIENVGIEVMERTNKSGPPIVLNAISSTTGRKAPSPQGGIVRPSQTQSPVVTKASLNLKKASLALEEVKQKRRILEQNHFHIQKRLELQKQKNKTRDNWRRQCELQIDMESPDGTIEVVQSNSEDEYDAKLKALEHRYRKIQERKAQHEADICSDEMKELKAEVERRAVEEFFFNLNQPSEEKAGSPNQKDEGGILGLVDKGGAETPATEQKRILNETAYEQLCQMVDSQMDLERRQRLTTETWPPNKRVEGPPAWNSMHHYRPTLLREGPPPQSKDHRFLPREGPPPDFTDYPPLPREGPPPEIKDHPSLLREGPEPEKNYESSLPPKEPLNGDQDVAAFNEVPYYQRGVCLAPSHLDDEAVGKELENLLSADSFFS